MISIILPVLNQISMTNECIKAVRDNTSNYEIIIIDNGSEPPYEIINLPECPHTYIRYEENFGFPVAVNQGIRAAKGENIILLNNDVIVTPRWADRLIKWLDEYDIIGPCTNYSAGYQRIRAFGIYHDIQGLNVEAEKWGEMHKGKADDVNWVIGFCMAFKKSLYEQLGIFDESVWPSSGEEIDFCLKAKNAGYRVGIAHDVYVHHIGSVTFKDINSKHPYRDIVEKSEKHLKDKWGDDYSSQRVDRNGA